MGPRAVLDAVAKRKIPSESMNFSNGPSTCCTLHKTISTTHFTHSYCANLCEAVDTFRVPQSNQFMLNEKSMITRCNL
jgi:hypothetical protein